MRIFVTGTRGIPDIPGGVEKHAEELYPRLAALGHEVTVCTRTPYVAERRGAWKGVRLSHVYAPRRKSLEAIVHTLLAVLLARWRSPDVVHVHAVGPALLVPLARLLGLKVVVTNHGPDYDRQKWGRAAKAVLRLGEKLGGVFAHEVIVISEVIAGIVRRRCGRGSNLIYNGVPLPERAEGTAHLERWKLSPGRYVLAVARLVPEKGLHDLVEAFGRAGWDGQLVIAGDADHESDYSRSLKAAAAANPRVVLTGYVTGEPLHQLFSHAGLFALPSYHEGLPIALLEALSYGLPVLVSDIPANLEVGLPAERYFPCGDVEALAGRLAALAARGITEAERAELRRQVAEKYDWDRIARETLAVYRKAVGRAAPGLEPA